MYLTTDPHAISDLTHRVPTGGREKRRSDVLCDIPVSEYMSGLGSRDNGLWDPRIGTANPQKLSEAERKHESRSLTQILRDEAREKPEESVRHSQRREERLTVGVCLLLAESGKNLESASVTALAHWALASNNWFKAGLLEAILSDCDWSKGRAKSRRGWRLSDQGSPGPPTSVTPRDRRKRG